MIIWYSINGSGRRSIVAPYEISWDAEWDVEVIAEKCVQNSSDLRELNGISWPVTCSMYDSEHGPERKRCLVSVYTLQKFSARVIEEEGKQ